MAHLFEPPTEDTVRIVAYCGAEFGPGRLELLNEIRGMPCEACIARLGALERQDRIE